MIQTIIFIIFYYLTKRDNTAVTKHPNSHYDGSKLFYLKHCKFKKLQKCTQGLPDGKRLFPLTLCQKFKNLSMYCNCPDC